MKLIKLSLLYVYDFMISASKDSFAHESDFTIMLYVLDNCMCRVLDSQKKKKKVH